MKKQKKTISIPIIFCLTFLLAIFVKLFILDIVVVSGTSINKLAYGIVKPFSSSFFIQWKTPKQNDIVIYLYNDKMVVKRCVATELTPLEYSNNSEYSVKVNEKLIPLTEQQFHRIKNSDRVPQGMIFAVGDNYLESVDSRNYGFVSVNNIIGKVLCK